MYDSFLGFVSLFAVALVLFVPGFLAYRGWIRGRAFAKEHGTHVRLNSEAGKGFVLASGLLLVCLVIPGLNIACFLAWVAAQFFWSKMALRPEMKFEDVALQAFTLTPIGSFAFFLGVEAVLQNARRDEAPISAAP